MSRCGACGRSTRKTSLAFVPGESGRISPKRVCATCYGRAIVIVPSVPVTTCPGCGAPATSCLACARKKEARSDKDAMKAAVRKILKLAKGYEMAQDETFENEQEHRDGRVAGLEQAAYLLEAGDY